MFKDPRLYSFYMLVFTAVVYLALLLFAFPASAQTAPSCTSNWLSRSCNTYPNPVSAGGTCNPIDTNGYLISGPNPVGTYQLERFYCNTSCNGFTEFAGYSGGKCNYMGNSCPSGQSWQYNGTNFSCVDDDCPFGDCEGSSSSASSSEPICVWGVDPETGDCLPEPSSSSSGNSSAGSSSGGGSASSSGGGNSSSGNGGDGGSGSSSPGNPVPADSTCPNKFQIGDQWYCQSNPMPSSEGQASSEGADAAAAGTCGAAPVCNGDPVGCAILLNAHYHRCNTDKQSTAAGSCGEEPSCTGDPVGCSVLKQTWLINCQDHQQNSDLVENNFGSGLDGIKAEDEGKFNELIETLNDSSPELDENGVLAYLEPERIDLSTQDFGLSDVYALGNSPSSGSCPPPRSIQLSVGNYEVSYDPLCDLATQLSGLLILIFSFLSSIIVWRAIQAA